MQKRYIYKSIILHIAVILLCIFDIPYFRSKHEFDDQPPILVNLDDVVISDVTNLPEKAVRGEERKVATRKEKPVEESAATKQPEPEPEPVKEEQKPEPVVEQPEIKAPTLLENTPKMEESKEEPRKEEDKKPVEKKRPAPIPQKKPQVKPQKKQEPEPEKKTKPTEKPSQPTTTKNVKQKTANPLESLMNSVDDLQKQIGEEDAPAQVRYDDQVSNMGIEGGNSKGSYFSELSVSGIDFVKSKIQESWKTVTGGDDRNMEVVVDVKLTKEGVIQSVNIEDKKRYLTDNRFKAIADSAERAIHIAQDVHNVFKVLARQNGSRYDEWKEIRFTFTPLGLTR